jgi:type IV pilus assembly protein PilP
MKRLSVLILVLMAGLLTACSGSDSYSDLKAWMAEVKAKPKGKIEPIPVFAPYQAFSYAATALRGPFDIPIKVSEISRLLPSQDVEPDKNRAKEFLERFNIESLSMVGTLEQNGQLWSLINDGEGGVHRVKLGNYLGRNHGRIVETTDAYLSVIEIVPNGLGGWIERPKTIKIKEKD